MSFFRNLPCNIHNYWTLGVRIMHTNTKCINYYHDKFKKRHLYTIKKCKIYTQKYFRKNSQKFKKLPKKKILKNYKLEYDIIIVNSYSFACIHYTHIQIL